MTKPTDGGRRPSFLRRLLRYLAAGLADVGTSMAGAPPIPRDGDPTDEHPGRDAPPPASAPEEAVPLTDEERAAWLELTRRLRSPSRPEENTIPD